MANFLKPGHFLLATWVGLWGAQAGLVKAQVKLQIQDAPTVKKVVPRVGKAGDQRAEDKKAKQNEEKYAGGAALKTNSDLEDLLKRASAFVNEKNYRNATILWDRVLAESQNSLITRDGETFISLVRQVEQTIRALPPNGLQVYRISADGKARALMPGAPAEAEEESLAQLVRLYFMSSLGDDAAYELGCRALDRRDFVGASRMFSKILVEHPDPSVSKNGVLARLAIAAGNLGDREAADRALAGAEGAADDESLIQQVQQHLDYIERNRVAVAVGGESVSMRLSGPDRSGVMPDLPESAVNGDLTQGYEFRFPFAFANEGADSKLGRVFRGGSSEREQTDTAISALSQRWKTEKWQPANQILFANNRIVLKTTNDLVCIDATTQSDLAIWHSLWLNHFALDDASWNAKTYGANARNRNGSTLPIKFPKNESEGWYFFDRIHQSMSIHNGVVFTIEGKNYSQLDGSPPRTTRSNTTRNFNQPINLTRSRTNYLTAYDLKTGKVQWTRSAFEKNDTDQEEEGVSQGKVGFLGTPVPFGNLLLCPVTEGGAISIYAMDATKKGKTAWKTFLCDDPSEGVQHFSPVEIAIAGQDAYVTCGSGVLFALNAATGNIQFARRYQRDGKKEKVQTSYNQNQEMLLSSGWADNTVIAWKNALIVMASDHDYLFAVDRRNGKFLWDAPRIPFDEDVDHAYCLGHCHDLLLMATNKSILCYSLAGDGKLQWYQKLGGNSFGRGFMTSEAAYIPVEDSIVKYDLKTGKRVLQVEVNLGAENKVGNLFSDGKQIWVVGLNRVVGLRSLRDRLVELGQKIAAGESSALGERLKIYAKLEEYDKALMDAQELYRREAADPAAALKQLLTHLSKSRIATGAASATLEFLDALLLKERDARVFREVVGNDYQVFFEAARSAVKVGDPNAVGRVLRWTGYEVSRGFRSAVVKFLSENPPDLEGVLAVTAEAGEQQLLTLIPIVARVRASNGVLVEMLKNDSESVRIAAASELALLGDKACLPAAFDLLESDRTNVRIEAFLILKNVTAADLPFAANGTPEERAAARAAWGKWLDENYETLEVRKPVQLRFGRVLIATSQKMMEFSIGKDLVKEKETAGYRPEDLSTTRFGSKVIAEYTNSMIRELDLSEKEVAKIALASPPRSVRKLTNGNYLVAWRDTTKPVVELDSRGKVVWQAKNLGGIAYAAERLDSGNTLITLSKSVVEIDEDSNIVYQLAGAQGVSNCKEARRLPNGNTLVVYSTFVSIFDKDKNQVLRIRGSFTPKSALQLRDGRILVAHATGVRMFDNQGTKIGDDFVNENVNSIWEY
ncbi:MAG: PQQ-binding-like beta-propeller repeat protein [Planctomycetota bacterium]|nr:PQQ-binding-like beta-propeller repeat protein [Planctomycetota bacterium]